MDFRQRGTGATQKLERNDRLEFGARDSTYAISIRRMGRRTRAHFLSQISEIRISQKRPTGKVDLFSEAARKLNTAGVLDEILGWG